MEQVQAELLQTFVHVCAEYCTVIIMSCLELSALLKNLQNTYVNLTVQLDNTTEVSPLACELLKQAVLCTNYSEITMTYSAN